MKDIHDIITHAKFGDDRLRDSGVVAGQISAFPIDFAGRPYNTLTLPCERVIITEITSNQKSITIGTCIKEGRQVYITIYLYSEWFLPNLQQVVTLN